jgi:serine/threonine-protein kinase RsbW
VAEVVELEIPARPEYLALARLLVAAAVASDPLFPEDRLDDLRLAVSEACTNAMEAQDRATVARAGGNGRSTDSEPIQIRCQLGVEQVEVEVVDHGQGFDPDALSEHPPVTDPSRLDYERGLGIPLIRILTDEVEFRPSPNGTSVRMVLYASAAGLPRSS